jgi:hypothetical protein
MDWDSRRLRQLSSSQNQGLRCNCTSTIANVHFLRGLARMTPPHVGALQTITKPAALYHSGLSLRWVCAGNRMHTGRVAREPKFTKTAAKVVERQQRVRRKYLRTRVPESLIRYFP